MSQSRVCKICKEEKGAEHFTPFKSGKNGLYPYCKSCRVEKSKEEWAKKPYQLKMFNRAKSRALQRGIEFTITVEDIPNIPERCPVMARPMDTPSLDRIHPWKGYVPGNIRIISNRANMLKSDATVEELELIIDDLRRIEESLE